MRTTVTIDDRLLKLAKDRAHALKITLGQLVELSLQAELSRSERSTVRRALPVFDSRLARGIDWASNSSIYQAVDEVEDVERV
ncbi:hypothetical protein GCM10027062_27990 [Nocardioides hungaricus]|jgi:hypothetical protein